MDEGHGVAYYLHPRIETLSAGPFKVFLGLEDDLVSAWGQSGIEFVGLRRLAWREKIKTATVRVGHAGK